jgi:hypothetical protein
VFLRFGRWRALGVVPFITRELLELSQAVLEHTVSVEEVSVDILEGGDPGLQLLDLLGQ